MVKKTLLSLAIAATTVGLAGCNISSVEKHNNNVDPTAVTAGSEGTKPSRVAPIFSAGSSNLPLANDLVFAINKQEDGTPGKDGTANVSDTTPPVTTALNKLDGFSTVAPIYIEFNDALDPETVVAGESVILVKMSNAEDDSSIDALNSDTIAASSAGYFSATPITADDYEARYTTLDDGMTPVIQVRMKKPLAPKTKYMVIVTNAVTSDSGEAIKPSAEFELLAGDLELASAALEPVREAVQGWQQLAGAYLASDASTQGSSVLSYTFTTGGTTDVLKAMAAPATFLTSQITSIAAAEYTISQSVIAQVIAAGGDQATADAQAAAALLQIAQGTAASINASAGVTVVTIDADTRTTLLGSEQLSPYYYTGLLTTIADGSGAGLDSVVDKPASRTYQPFATGVSAPVAVSYEALFTAKVTESVTEQVTEQVEANRTTIAAQVEAAVLAADSSATTEQIEAAVEQEIQDQIDAGVAGQAATITATVTALDSGGAIYQGGLEIPNYLPEAAAGVADDEIGSWVGSDSAAQALGLTGAPVDVNGVANVTYRFPFAEKAGDNVVPVMVTLPDSGTCAKPADGYPVVIYQHGITVDRTAGVLVGNALAKSCVAMVAIDHAMHGVGPTSSTGLVFNVDTVAEGAVAGTATQALSPFALTRAGLEAAGSTFFGSLKERHNNVGKDASGQNVAMEFEAAGATADVGASGDLYINLKDFSRTRDGMRQTVIDLMNLNASIDDMDINADGTADELDPANVYFIGHSLGGIIGTTFLGVNNDPDVQAFNSNLPEIKAAFLGNPGGGVVKLLENSPAIGASKILPGLNAAAGLEQGSSNIEKFFGVLQATVDSADPINFAYAEHMQNLPIITYTAVGDVVVPNNTLAPYQYELVEGEVNVVMDGTAPAMAPDASQAFLSGTDPLVAALGLSESVIDGTATAGLNAGTRFSVRLDSTKSEHATFSSADPAETFTEIFTQIGSFLQTGMTAVLVTDTEVLEQAAE